MAVAINDKLGRGTHSSQPSDFNVLYGTSVTCSISKSKKEASLLQANATHFLEWQLFSRWFLVEGHKTHQHHFVEKGKYLKAISFPST